MTLATCRFTGVRFAAQFDRSRLGPAPHGDLTVHRTKRQEAKYLLAGTCDLQKNPSFFGA